MAPGKAGEDATGEGVSGAGSIYGLDGDTRNIKASTTLTGHSSTGSTGDTRSRYEVRQDRNGRFQDGDAGVGTRLLLVTEQQIDAPGNEDLEALSEGGHDRWVAEGKGDGGARLAGDFLCLPAGLQSQLRSQEISLQI